MAKESGLGWTTLTVAAANIMNDITNIATATPRGVQDITGVDKSAYERLLLLADFSVTLTGVFNDATPGFHTTFKTVPSSSATRAVALAVSGQSITVNCMFTDYPLTRAQTGELTAACPGVLSDGAVPTWS